MPSPRKYGVVPRTIALALVSLFGIFSVVVLVEFLSAAVLSRRFPSKSLSWASPGSSEARPAAFAYADDYEEVRKWIGGETSCPANRIVYDQLLGFPRFESTNVSCDGPETIAQGLRLTVNQETSPRRNIYMFGGSTLWGSGSADRNTIPSLLQASDVARSGKYAVWNYGFATVVASQQLARLRSIDLKAGDVVVFYDGGNDVWQGVVYGRPEGTIIGYNEGNTVEKWRNKLKFFLSRHSNFYMLLHNLRHGESAGQRQECVGLAPDSVSARASRGFDVYFASLLAAKRHAEGRGALFVHFFQPALVSSRPFSPYVQDLVAKMPPDQRCGLAPLEMGLRHYRQRYSEVRDSINGTDLSQVLHGPGDTAYFFDWIHTSSVGNKRIAEEIRKLLGPRLSNASPVASSSPR